jgi:hypothetical protein
MTLIDRRELEFNAEALMLAVGASLRPAQAFGLPGYRNQACAFSPMRAKSSSCMAQVTPSRWCASPPSHLAPCSCPIASEHAFQCRSELTSAYASRPMLSSCLQNDMGQSTNT